MATTQNKLSLIEQSRLTSDKTEEVLQKVNALLSAGEIKLRDISKFSGFAQPTISQVLSGSYEGDVEKLQDGVVRFYRSWLAKSAVIETEAVRIFQATMELTWRRKEIARITGQFGRGKSKAATHYCALNQHAVYLELTSTTSPASLLNRIGDALNVRANLTGSQDDRLHAIIRALQRNPRLIVIDEADNLRPKTLALLKDIHGGEAEERCGIVLIGTERLKKLLQHPELGYLNRRIRIKREISDITSSEATEIMKMWPIDFERDDYTKAYNWAMSHFGVASLVALMARAYDVMQMNRKKKIDSDCLDDAFTFLVD
jgi:DNA transposition AAA+ family ATPase